MKLLELYKDENKQVLYSISWFNKNSIFDKSIGAFVETDLFSFLESVNRFNYDTDIYYDDIYYILLYTENSISHLINNINKEVKREHKILPISRAKEFDRESVVWLSRQNGRTIKEKLKNNKIKAVQRYSNIDTYENRVFKILLKKLVLIYEVRDDLYVYDHLLGKIRKWLRSDESKAINEYKNIVYNNLLLHHKHYSKIFKSYKWINSLNSKIDRVLDKKNLFFQILYFDLISQLQHRTRTTIFPNRLELDNNDLSIEYSYAENVPINHINIEQIRIKNLMELQFSEIRKDVHEIIKEQLKLPLLLPNNNVCDSVFNDLYIDFFRLFPSLKSDVNFINCPLTMKQKIGKSIVSANGTKIIDLNSRIYTLPEILESFDINIFKLFIQDFLQLFENKNVNYIIPDYVNVFDFSILKKTFTSYYKRNRSIPKSILAGLSYLYNGDIEKDDTLIFIQKDHQNSLYITPLLVRYNEKHKNVFNGLYLERHPTKKLRDNRDILDNLNRLFPEKISKKVLTKFLQNGIKKLQEQQIVFYYNNSTFNLENFEIPDTEINKLYIDEIRKLYPKGNLFSEYKFITDDQKKNLDNYEKLLGFENQGLLLWKDNLPDLSMEIVNNGYFDRFVLVDAQSNIIENKILIREHFIIPRGISTLSFPLILDDENIGYKALLSSSELPFETDVECELHLTYDYERENPYELVFKPINNLFKNVYVEWIQDKVNAERLPIPNYPVQKSWIDFLKDPKRNGKSYSDLLDWIDERLALLEIDSTPDYIIEKELAEYKNQKTGTFEWGTHDKNNNYYCRVLVDGESVFCHSSKFLEEIDTSLLHEGKEVYLDVSKRDNGYVGNNIRFSKMTDDEIKRNIMEKLKVRNQRESIYDKTNKLVKAIKSLRYPLLTVWNSHSIQDEETPIWFKQNIERYIQQALKLIVNKEVAPKLKEELLFVLSCLHQDMPRQIYNMLEEFSKDKQAIKKYSLNFGLSLGNLSKSWQTKILNNILQYLEFSEIRHYVFEVLAIAAWRAEAFIFQLEKETITKIIKYLLEDLKNNIQKLKYNNSISNIKHVAQNLELLLAILRYRKTSPLLLKLNDIQTQTYIRQLDKLNRHVIENNINIKTRIDLQMDKPEVFNKMPDLIYALRIYLSGDNGAANTIKILGVSDD